MPLFRKIGSLYKIQYIACNVHCTCRICLLRLFYISFFYIPISVMPTIYSCTDLLLNNVIGSLCWKKKVSWTRTFYTFCWIRWKYNLWQTHCKMKVCVLPISFHQILLVAHFMVYNWLATFYPYHVDFMIWRVQIVHLCYHLGTMCSNLKYVFVSKGLLNFHGEE